MSQKHSLQEFINILKDHQLVVGVYCGGEKIDSNLKQLISHLTFDSREVQKDTLFVCKGENFQEDYLDMAIEKGAIGFVAEEKYKDKSPDVIGVQVSDIRKAMLIIGELFYNYPSRQIVLTGITGTKGKSTTAYFLKNILDFHCIQEAGKRTAILSSIDFYDGLILEEAHLTTPESITIQKHLRNAVDSKIKYCTMEVSSQGLKYERIGGLLFDAGLYLNLGEDHISPREHSDFNDYKEAKKTLMRQAKRVFINLDDDYAQEFYQEAERAGIAEEIVGFSLEEREGSSAYAKYIANEKHGQSFIMVLKDDQAVFAKKAEIGLKGRFNVSNALAAAAVAFSYGVPLNTIVEGLAEARVPGRMESFYSKRKDVELIVDYAHNQMSFTALFEAYKDKYTKDRIAVVYGSAGCKAYARRRELSELAAKYAGRIYITDEDPGEEAPEKIKDDIGRVLDENGASYSYRGERRDAIELAFKESRPGDIVFILGKGREKTQKRGRVYEPTESDVEIVESLL